MSPKKPCKQIFSIVLAFGMILPFENYQDKSFQLKTNRKMVVGGGDYNLTFEFMADRYNMADGVA